MTAWRGATAALIVGLILSACGGAAGPPVASSVEAKPSGAASAGSSGKPTAGSKITLPYTAPSAAFGALFVAADEGLYLKQGLQVDLRSMDAAVAAPALLSGEVEYAASPSLVNSILAGADVTFIARLSNGPMFTVFGTKGAGRIEDLRGKVVADTTVGSAPDSALRDILAKHGMKETDVQLIHVPNPAAVMAAMQAGSAVAGIVPPPVTLQARNAGYSELTTTAKEGVLGISAPIVTKKARLRDKPDEVRSMLLALRDATAFMHGNAERTKAIIGKYTRTDPGPDLDEVYAAFEPLWELGPMRAGDVAASIRYLPEPNAATADPNKFFDNSVVEALLR